MVPLGVENFIGRQHQVRENLQILLAFVVARQQRKREPWVSVDDHGHEHDAICGVMDDPKRLDLRQRGGTVMLH